MRLFLPSLAPLILLIFLIALPAFAQSPPSYNHVCEPPDYITIEDDGPGKAIVTYYNSINKCSRDLIITMVSPAGISVDITVSIGSINEEHKEIIRLYPNDEQMMAFPPEEEVEDGETKTFLIMGGMS